MKFKSHSFIHSLVIFLCFFAGCRNQPSVPTAQVPSIVSISDDVFTIINKEVSVSVNATISDSGTLSYQWYFSEDKLSEGVRIENANQSDYIINTKTSGNTYYYCVVKNTLGDSSRTVLSPRILVSISEKEYARKPIISVQPQNFSGSFGENFAFDVSAVSVDGGDLSYQWYHNSLAIEGAVEPLYSEILGQTKLGEYYCVITNQIEDNGDGGQKTAQIKTNVVCLSNNLVNANLPMIVSQPVSVTAVIPATRVFTVGAYSVDDGELTYQWYTVTEEGESGEIINDATNPTYKVTAYEISKIGYYCVVTNTIEDNGDGGQKIATVTTETVWFDAIYLKDVVSAPAFTVQPRKINLAVYNHGVKLECNAESAEYDVAYKWYKSVDGTTENGIPIEGANGDTYITEAIAGNESVYYYCVVYNILPVEDSENIKSEVAFSNIARVIYTELPVVTIDTVNKEEPTAVVVNSKDNGGNYGATLRDATKVPGRIKIYMDGKVSPIYDSGEYEKKNSGCTIKIRGNTSAVGEKKPYKIKLQKKADLLANLLGRYDDKYKDKDWILLKDTLTLRTVTGFMVSDYAGVSWTPEYAFVNVIFNNDYLGPYILIESINRSEKRIDVADDGYIIERDAYWWNEDVKFFTNSNQKFTFKYPDSDDITPEQITYIENYMNEIEQHVKDGTYDEYIDVDSFARWLLVHDILGNNDGAGSNIYMTKYDSSENSKLFMSTPWDFDGILVRTNSFSAVHGTNRMYSKWMLNSENKAFLNAYKTQWNILAPQLLSYLTSELEKFDEEFGEDLDLSRMYNTIRWSSKYVANSNPKYTTVHDDILTVTEYMQNKIVWLDNAINELN